MSKSIMQTEKQCYFCGCVRNLDRHHVFFGTANRRLSEEDGCWIWCCKDHHTLSGMSVHQDRKMDLLLKAQCQETWEEIYGDRKKFIQRYGKSYI